ARQRRGVPLGEGPVRARRLGGCPGRPAHGQARLRVHAGPRQAAVGQGPGERLAGRVQPQPRVQRAGRHHDHDRGGGGGHDDHDRGGGGGHDDHDRGGGGGHDDDDRGGGGGHHDDD